MSAQELRDAAALMRERADAAEPGRWKLWGMTVMADPKGTSNVDDGIEVAYPMTPSTSDRRLHTGNAEHIASWHPAVALAVADWLEAKAEQDDKGTCDDPRGCCNLCEHDYGHVAALEVARAYLGSAS